MSLQSLSLAFAFCLVFSACKKETQEEQTAPASGDQVFDGAKKNNPTPTLEPFATGLNNPRGLKFGPDGNLYVAEAGTGIGNQTTVGSCTQAPFPFGPYTGSPVGGRVSRINAQGVRTTVTEQLPTTMANPAGGGDVMGASDVAFMGNTLYVLIAGGGCSHGVPQVPNGIVRINPNGSPTVIADLGSWQIAHPVANPEPGDFEPDGVWYSMVAQGNDFIALEPNHGDLVKVSLNGTISRIADISATEGHVVPTALAYKGNYYVGNLGTFPITGQSNIYKITPSGNIKVVATGFSAITGLVIDQNSRMYVLEMTAGAPFPTPGLGRITKVEPNGDKEVLISGLFFPTAMTMGPDDNLYVSIWGFGMPPGGGKVMRVRLN
jgi:hypothetical protein